MSRKLFLLLTLSLASCLSGYDVASTDVSPVDWSEPAEIRYTNRDTLSVRDLALVFRHNNFNQLGGDFVVGVVSPTGVEVREDVSVVLNAALRETRVPFRRRVMLSESGDYVFTITPLQSLCGVWSVALEFGNGER